MSTRSSSTPHIGARAAIAAPATTETVKLAGGVGRVDGSLTAPAPRSFRDIVPHAEMANHPYLCIGRLEARPRTGGTWFHAGSGVLVGPYHLLTAAHMFMEDDGGWEEAPFPFTDYEHRFVPAFWRGTYPLPGLAFNQRSARLTGRVVTGDRSWGFSGGGSGWDLGLSNIVYGWDFILCELDRPIGDNYGGMPVIAGGKSFYEERRWISVGYPQSTADGEEPSRHSDVEVIDVENDLHGSKEIELHDAITPGWSGGPLFTHYEGQWVVGGIASGREYEGPWPIGDGTTYVFAGGQRLLEVVEQGHRDWRPRPDLGPTPQAACGATGGGFLHLLAIDRQDGLWHTVREPNGAWLPFGDVQAQTRAAGGPDLGPTPRVACAVGQGPRLHVLAIDRQDGLWHTVREPDGAWLSFGDVQAQTREAGGPDLGPTPKVACATGGSGQDLHVLALDRQNGLWHTVRTADGGWLPFGDVQAQTREAGGPDLGPTPFAACAMSPAGDLHVLAIDAQDGLWHSARLADGTWLPFGDVQAQTRAAGGPDLGPTPRVACATGANGEMHVLAIDRQNGLWHTVRTADGGWLPFGDVQAQTREAGGPDLGPTPSATCSMGPGGELHVLAIDAQDGLWHTVRRADGNWLAFGDVQSQTR